MSLSAILVAILFSDDVRAPEPLPAAGSESTWRMEMSCWCWPGCFRRRNDVMTPPHRMSTELISWRHRCRRRVSQEETLPCEKVSPFGSAATDATTTGNQSLSCRMTCAQVNFACSLRLYIKKSQKLKYVDRRHIFSELDFIWHVSSKPTVVA